MNDLVTIMSLQAGWQRSDGAYTVTNPIDGSGFGTLFQVKQDNPPNGVGFPFDCILFDANNCYDKVTERDKPGWSNPNNIKIHTGSDGKGTLIGPRNIASGLPSAEYITEVTSYESWANGPKNWAVTDLIPHSVGRSRTTWGYTSDVDWGGNVGKIPTFIRYYQWGGKQQADGSWIYSDLETYIYASPWGEIQWTHATLDPKSGMYVVDNAPGLKSTFKKVTSVPPVNFPMFGKVTP